MTALADLVRRRHSPCSEVASSLPAFVAGETQLDTRTAAHVGQCLRCQAEIVRYRRMLRTLHALRDETPDAPPTVLADILARLGTDDGGQWRLFGLVTVVALAAGSAGGAGLVLWAQRRRPVPSGIPDSWWPGRSRVLPGRPPGPTWVVQEMATRFSTRSARTKAMTTA